ncbi:MAG: substrate-binding domain-containing protein [Euzebyales bacterium]|nr:substrate-binding domain-containing protein [Euzebyales bacterium]
MNRGVRILSMLAVLLLLLIACGDSGGGVEDAAADGDAAAGGDAVDIAAVIKGLDNPFFGAMNDGIEAQADERGVPVTVQAAQDLDDTAGQADRLETLAGQDFDCYIVNPISQTNLVQPLVQLAEEGVPIVNIDSPVGEEAAADAGIEIATYIGTDNVAAGRLGAEHMNELLGGSGQVALVGGVEGDATSNARLDGFREGAGDLEIVQTVAADWDRETALTAAENILRANPDLGGLFAANDVMALGIAQALRNADLIGDIVVIGVDGIEDALDAIEQGGLTATVSQYPYTIGQLSVDACVAAGDAELPATVDAPVQLVTPDNVAQAQENFPEPVADYDNPFADLIGS